MYNSLKLAAVLVAVSATAASAQGNRNRDVPPGQRPQNGMCRVWVTGVAPGRQSAPTDCATAEAQARLTANSRVIYGGFPGRKGNHSNDDLLTRRRQLADGSWVVDRYRRDANGNLTIVSTRPIGTNGARRSERKSDRREMRNERKSDKREMKSERKSENREMKKNDRGDDQNEMRGMQHEGKGKGKH